MNNLKLLFAAVLMTACTQTTPIDVNKNVPAHAVMAHRGSTYWTPEETESAWRWALRSNCPI